MSEPASDLPVIESPCIGVCTLDSDGVCAGCHRTAEEIAGWLGFSARRRQEIMATLADRAHARGS